MNINQWAIKWGIPREALEDLKQDVGLNGLGTTDARTEAGVTKLIRLEAAEKGIHLFRNNVGATMDDKGNYFRYGLANDTPAMNKRIKSSDLIGIKPGGQFVCREVKKPGWQYSGTDREIAQLKFLKLVLASGGDAAFATGVGTL